MTYLQKELRESIARYLPDNFTAKASGKGDLTLLKFAYENGCHIDEYTSSEAAKYGHVKCLEYIFENKISCHEYLKPYIILCAAKYGNLDCLKICHLKNCQWNVGVTYEAAINGHLDCLMYLAPGQGRMELMVRH